MRIYQPGTTGRRGMYVTPGAKFPASDWLDETGKPIMFHVIFENGMADVETKLGEFMIAEKMASRTSLIEVRGTLLTVG